MKRQNISPAVRFDVLTRCNFACYYCGVPASLGAIHLHIEHVIPIALGGTDAPWNLVAACVPCNQGKAATSPGDELVKRVRADYSAYLSARGARTDVCKCCGVPEVLEADEEAYGQCSSCNEVIVDAYDEGRKVGYRMAREDWSSGDWNYKARGPRW